MTSSPPPNRSPSDRDALGFDDFIGILVAFASVGAVLLWVFSQNKQGLDLPLLASPPALLPSPSPTVGDRNLEDRPVEDRQEIVAPSATPEPEATVTPPPQPEETPAAGLPAVVPFVVGAASQASPTASPTTGFSDVASDFWAAPFISELVRRDILEGFPDGTFRPNQPVTRAEFATLVQKAFDQPARLQSRQFSDLAPDFWANDAIDDAVKMGFLKGYPNNTFQPNQFIPKVEILTALANGLALPAPLDPVNTLSLYQDADQIPAYAVDKIAASTTAGLIVNYPAPDRVEPQRVTTRADAAALIYQSLVQAGKAERINSEYVVQPKG